MTGGYEGLHVVDVSDPYNPLIIGSLDILGDTYGVVLHGGYIFMCTISLGYSALEIWPVPMEISSVTVSSGTDIHLSLPITAWPGNYTLSVFNKTESSELSGTVTFVPAWIPISAQYSMTTVGQGYLNAEKIETEGYTIAAFGPGGASDCRGKADITETDGKWEYHLTIVSDNNGEEITFGIWDNNTGQIYDMKDIVIFEEDADRCGYHTPA